MPFPNPDTQFKPGQSGNPDGHSASRRVSSALIKLIDKEGADSDLVKTWLAMALGKQSELEGRKPDFQFFKELLDRIEGKVTDKFEFKDVTKSFEVGTSPEDL